VVRKTATAVRVPQPLGPLGNARSEPLAWTVAFDFSGLKTSARGVASGFPFGDEADDEWERMWG
jgi:hypothetical protein